MSVRTAELLMAILLSVISIALMVKSLELNIGWVPERGPGSGAWPFWLSAGMLLCCFATIWRWFKGLTPESRSDEVYISRPTLMLVGTTIVALTLLLIGTTTIGIYFSLMAFIFFYIKIMGSHSWLMSMSFTILTPIVIFCLFEWALTISLPKGMSEPLFYPIYDLMY